MICWYCHESMGEHKGTYSVTYLDIMVSLRIKHCHYFYCEKCDIVSIPHEEQERIEKAIRESSKYQKINL